MSTEILIYLTKAALLFTILSGLAAYIMRKEDDGGLLVLPVGGAIVLLVCLVFLAIPLAGGKAAWETTADTAKSETPESALVIRVHDGRRDSTEDWDTIHMDKMYIEGLFDEDGNPVPYTIEDIDAE